LSQLVGNSGRVVSLEAQPRTFELLDWSFEISGLNVKRVNKAVFNESGIDVRMTFIPDRALNNELIIGDDFFDSRSKKTVTVKTISIDDLVREQGLKKVDFMKIDVEGVEDSVWDGMSETLKNNPNLIVFMETNTARMINFKKDPETFYRKIEKRFPTIRHVEDGGRIQIITVEEMLARKDGSDIF
ncbi:hypothetical protein HK096_001626, partial [Nowakowskiella sp. JEL0078]